MSCLYIDPIGGLSGDMLLGALFHAGLDFEQWSVEMERLNLPNWRMEQSQVKRGAFAATHIKILPVERVQNKHAHHAGPSPEGWDKHHRTHAEIKNRIAQSTLPDRAKEMAMAVFENLAAAEAKIHGQDIGTVHFHEVGAVDSIVDIVGICLGLTMMDVEEISCGPLPTSHGMIQGAHGYIPLPAPATLSMLMGWPLRPGVVNHEHVTPTGAAIVSTLAKPGHFPAMIPFGVGWGAGGRDPEEYPNVVRVVLGEIIPAQPEHPTLGDETPTQVWAIATHVDDMTGEQLPVLIERTLAAGALDAYAHPIVMKKGRSGLLFTALCQQDELSSVERCIFQHSTTFGLRITPHQRTVLHRHWKSVETPWGPVRIKVGALQGEVLQRSVEFEDALAIAKREDLPLATVMDAALHKWDRT